MLTSATDTGPGTLFTKASEKSGFGQVFRNNMDKNSFFGDMNSPIEQILSKSQHAYINDQVGIRNSEAYRNCQVEKLFSILSKYN